MGEAVGERLDDSTLEVDSRVGGKYGVPVASRDLSEPIAGHELRLERGGDGQPPVASGAVILARRGKVQRVPLHVSWNEAANELTEGGVLAEAASAAWTGLPDWVRAWLTNRGAAPTRA